MFKGYFVPVPFYNFKPMMGFYKQLVRTKPNAEVRERIIKLCRDAYGDETTEEFISALVDAGVMERESSDA